MSLKQALKLCDASSIDEMLKVYSHFCCEQKFEKDLVAFLAEQPLERAASWVLKHHLEQGFMLSDKNARNVISTFPNLQHWEARLHILQILSLLFLSEKDADELWPSVKVQTQDSNKLIRAWAYNGLHEIAKQAPVYKEEAGELLRSASENDEAASVQARIRKVLKAGDYES